MVKEPGFGMILKSAGPDDVHQPPSAFAAAKMEEYGVIIGDKHGEEIGRCKISLQLIMAAN